MRERFAMAQNLPVTREEFRKLTEAFLKLRNRFYALENIAEELGWPIEGLMGSCGEKLPMRAKQEMIEAIRPSHFRRPPPPRDNRGWVWLFGGK